MGHALESDRTSSACSGAITATRSGSVPNPARRRSARRALRHQRTRWDDSKNHLSTSATGRPRPDPVQDRRTRKEPRAAPSASAPVAWRRTSLRRTPPPECAKAQSVCRTVTNCLRGSLCNSGGLRRLRAKPIECRKQLVDVRDMMQEWRYVAVSNDAALVEDVQRTLGETIVVAVHLILPRHLTFGVEVSEQWETNATNRGPCAVTVNAVDGDPDNARIAPLELVQFPLIQVKLLAAARTPVQGVKDQYGRPSSVFCKAHDVTACIRKGEIGSQRAGCQWRVAAHSLHLRCVPVQVGNIVDGQTALAERRGRTSKLTPNLEHHPVQDGQRLLLRRVGQLLE